MTDFHGFRGAAKKIEDIDLPRIGHEIGVGEDEIHAVLEVESAGHGFDSLGRPKILFEPHIFYRELPTVPLRDRAVREGLAYPYWGQQPYPKDSYPRLLRAMAIDETAALKSASWGLGQILGNNHLAAGYPTVQAMVLDFMADEDRHLSAMVNFIKNKHLVNALRQHDWDAVARGYNGAGYRTHNYQGRLAAAFARWKRIKDTPYDPGIRTSAEIETATDEEIQNAPAPPEEVAAEKTATKPLTQSKTMWGGFIQWIAGAGGALIAAVQGMPPWLIGLIVVALLVGLFLVIKGRIDVQKVLRGVVGVDDPTVSK